LSVNVTQCLEMEVFYFR